jgi:hypothetical protein
MVDKIIERSNQTIKIPVWSAGLLLALLIPLLSFLMTFSSEHGKLMQGQEMTKAEIVKIENNKVDKSLLDGLLLNQSRMENTLNRIELKIDNHIDKGK